MGLNRAGLHTRGCFSATRSTDVELQMWRDSGCRVLTVDPPWISDCVPTPVLLKGQLYFHMDGKCFIPWCWMQRWLREVVSSNLTLKPRLGSVLGPLLFFFSLKVFMKLFNLSWDLKTVHLSFFFLKKKKDFEVVVFKRIVDFKRFCLLPVNLFLPFSFCCVLFTSVLIIILPLENFVTCPPFLLNAFSTVYSFIHLLFSPIHSKVSPKPTVTSREGI